MANRFTAPMLLLLAGLCGLPTRSVAADEKEKKPTVTRPAISEEVSPLEAIAPVVKDGHKGEAYLRKPPGKGPFPAVVLVHPGIVRWPTAQLKAHALGAWSTRWLAAGFVVVDTTYRSRDIDPQSRESPDDVFATVDYVRKLSYVDPKSIVVNGCSGGGDLALSVASEIDVAVIVPEEPASMFFTGNFNKGLPKKGERYTAIDTAPLWTEPKKYYTAEYQKRSREKIARMTCEFIFVQGEGPNQLFPQSVDFNRVILFPELLNLGKNLVVLSYPGEPHCFAFYSNPDRTPHPAVAESAFEDVAALVRRHLRTKPSPMDPSLVKQVPFKAK